MAAAALDPASVAVSADDSKSLKRKVEEVEAAAAAPAPKSRKELVRQAYRKLVIEVVGTVLDNPEDIGEKEITKAIKKLEDSDVFYDAVKDIATHEYDMVSRDDLGEIAEIAKDKLDMIDSADVKDVASDKYGMIDPDNAKEYACSSCLEFYTCGCD